MAIHEEWEKAQKEERIACASIVREEIDKSRAPFAGCADATLALEEVLRRIIERSE